MANGVNKTHLIGELQAEPQTGKGWTALQLRVYTEEYDRDKREFQETSVDLNVMVVGNGAESAAKLDASRGFAIEVEGKLEHGRNGLIVKASKARYFFPLPKREPVAAAAAPSGSYAPGPAAVQEEDEPPF